MTKRMVALNENGRRIGEGHHRSTIPDAVVRTVRDMHEMQGLGYRKIAKMLGMSRSTVQKICNYSRRAQLPFDWVSRDIRDEEEEDGQ